MKQRPPLWLSAASAILAAAAATSAAQDAPVKQLVELSKPETVHFTVQNKAKAEIAAGAKGASVLKVTCPAGKGYPGVHLRSQPTGTKAEPATWDLTGRAWVAARVHNPTDHAMRVLIRADNAGDWRKGPWNTQPSSVPAGETREVKVWFGYSHGNKAFELDPSKVVAVLVFLMNPKQEGVFHVEGLCAGGKTGDRPPFAKRDPRVRPAGGVLFSASAAKGCKIDARSAEARLVKVEGATRLAVTIKPDGKEKAPGVALRATEAATWDLGSWNHVEFHLVNPGNQPVTVQCRLDNKGAGKGRKSVAGQAAIPPGAAKVLRLPFVLPPADLADKRGVQGRFESDNVVCARIFTDKPTKQQTVHLVRVQAGVATATPDWLGKRPPVPGDWKQTLNENFDGGKLNEKLWTPRLCWDGPLERDPQRYSTKNVYVEDGCFCIRAEKLHGHQYDDPNLPERDYASGAATTLGKWTQRYGYVEAKVKLPRARGLWPAFWAFPDRGEASGLDIWQRRSVHDQNGKGMEIDIMEHLTRHGPNRYNIACHWDGYGKDHKSNGSDRIYVEPTKDGWLVSGLLWEPGKLAWYCNGRKVGQWASERVPDVPLFLKLTVQMGGWGGNRIVDGDLPDVFKVDYVRAWQRGDLDRPAARWPGRPAAKP